ncbi:patatin-like phospholipase family protein [Hahella sp. SMD15-11]|uniref:Patatin-like phospholipase family protein n=1 Tax=Thermohahella caldifontis TaxID=3142973 RepID=A0AB39USI6_9GAMM
MNHPMQSKTRPHNGSRIGLVLGGGGALGAIYEIGALRALDEALEGVDFNHLYVYVGVNAGAFIAANLANQMTTAQMCRIFVRNEADVHPFHPDVLYRPAFREYGRRMLAVPGLLMEAAAKLLANPGDQTVLDAFTTLAQAAPAGLFENSGLEAYLARSYSLLGRTNDFRQLRHRLYLLAADLETGEAVRFGAPGLNQVPISKAVQASTATPVLYMPVEINGRHYVDGTIRRGMHASVALEDGAELVLAINPVVPIDAPAAVAAGTMSEGALLNKGMPNVVAQAYRAMVYSRMNAGFELYEAQYPGRTLLRFEPRRDDARLFFSNIFSFQSRRVVCEHAYQMTRRDLLARYEELSEALAPFGVTLKRDVLEDDQRTLSTSLYGASLPLYRHAEPTGFHPLKQLGERLEDITERFIPGRSK